MSSGRVYLDKQHRKAYLSLAATSKVVGEAAEEAGLSPLLMELIKVRLSQLNGCAFCLDLHVPKLLEAGETQQRLAVLPAWRDAGMFSDRERAALALAESVNELPEPELQDAAYELARSVLTDAEISAVSWIAIMIGAFNRLSITSRHPVRPR